MNHTKKSTPSADISLHFASAAFSPCRDNSAAAKQAKTRQRFCGKCVVYTAENSSVRRGIELYDVCRRAVKEMASCAPAKTICAEESFADDGALSYAHYISCGIRGLN